MLWFENNDQYEKTLEVLNNLSDEEIQKWENNIGFIF